MQMSKQEKIIVIVLLILVILGIGIFVFILPNYNDIKKNQKDLDAVNSSYSDILSRLERENTIDSDITAEYEAGKNLADGFYNDLTPVEADEIMRKFIAKGNNIRIDGLSVGPMTTENLSVSVFAPNEVTYPLKSFSQTAIGGDSTESVDIESMSDRELFMYAKSLMASLLALSEPVTVGVSTVSFTAYSDSLQNLHDFADLLNEGIYDETIVDANGKPQRKATCLNGAIFQLDEQSDEILSSSDNSANNGSSAQNIQSSADSKDSNASSSAEKGGWDAYKMDFVVKLYCIEPVSNPFGGDQTESDTAISSESA